jgi:hypothetical protein
VGLGAGPAGVAEVDRGVELGLVEQEGAGLGAHVHHHVRILRLEPGQARQQPARGEGRHHRQFEHAAGAVVRHHRQRVVLDRIQPRRDLAAVAQPRLGELHAAPGAAEQRHAEEVLQRGDLAADRALRQRELLRRAGEALVARGGLEGEQRGGAGDLLAHRRFGVPEAHRLLHKYRLR